MNSNNEEPESWGDILRGYRKTYGAQSFAAVNPGERPDIFNRTKLVQLDVNSKRLYDIGADYEKKTQAVDVERHARHGRGLTLFSMNEDDAKRRGELNVTGRLATAAPPASRPPAGPETYRMFAVLSMGNSAPILVETPAEGQDTRSDDVQPSTSSRGPAPASAPTMRTEHRTTVRDNGDSWIGHHLINPAMGKRPIVPPPDPRGRRGLSEVLNQCAPGKPSDDSWLGHRLIDPSKGKAHPLGPEQRMGRKDLFPVIQQQAILEERVGGAVTRGPDPLGDSWIGHAQIDPRKGKAWVDKTSNGGSLVQECIGRWDARPNNKLVDDEFGPRGKVRRADAPLTPVKTTIPAILVYKGPYPEDLGNRIRKYAPAPRGGTEAVNVNRKRSLRGPVGLSNIRSKDYEQMGKVVITRTHAGSLAGWTLGLGAGGRNSAS